MRRIELRGYPTNAIVICYVINNITAFVDSRDALNLRYAPSWRCGNGFNECHEIDRRLDGAIRNCLGDFTDQVLQSVAGVLDAVGVNGGEAEATARNILARSQPLFTFADESNTRLMQAGAEVYGLGRVKSLLRGETCGSGKGAKTAG